MTEQNIQLLNLLQQSQIILIARQWTGYRFANCVDRMAVNQTFGPLASVRRLTSGREKANCPPLTRSNDAMPNTATI